MDYLELTGEELSLPDIVAVAYGNRKVKLAQAVYSKMQASADYLQSAIAQQEIIYGVNTNFGGMAYHHITSAEMDELQENLLFGLKCGVGNKLPITHVRAGMLIRANSLARGASGIRPEIVERLCIFLNAHMTPIVYDQGSIGASGDLIPLAYIAGTIIGLSETFKINWNHKEIDALTALRELKLSPIKLLPKEALALINGTAMLNGIAALCVHEADFIFNLNLHIHGMLIQALQCSEDPFVEFVHQQKPFRGQMQVAEKIRNLLTNSKFVSTTSAKKQASLLQDRYSIRCLPQYLGVILDGIKHIKLDIECEANSTTDNPLIDVKNKQILHSGNFFGQYISVGMDQLRYYLALLVKHLDVQLALVMSPEFSHGLPGSLAYSVGNIKFGLKGLQICANSIMPQIMHLSQGIALLFPTHAEQFNQNINSQGFASANLTWHALQLTKQYLSTVIICAIQAIEQRNYLQYLHYNCIDSLSLSSQKFYNAVYQVAQLTISTDTPFIFSLAEQDLESLVNLILSDLNKEKGIIRNKIIC